MTDVNDLYEVNDREPEETEAEPREPLDLEDLETSWFAMASERKVLGEHGMAVLDAFPRLLEELVESRERIAAFEALPTREEWVVTGGPNFPAEPGGPPVWPDAGVIAYVNRHATAQLWRRLLTVRPYEPVDERGPF